MTRFNVAPFADEPDFEAARFVEIAPGSEVREQVGFIPMEPEAPYEVGARRWAFRVRIDKLKPDPTAVKERVKQLVRVELETTGAQFVGSKKRKQLRELAEEELIVRTNPSSKIIEACIDGDVLYVASTAKSYLGKVTAALRKIGIAVDYKTPWLDLDDPDIESEIVEAYEPGQSVLGCRFLKVLMEDREVMIEGEAGSVQLKTSKAHVSLRGAVLTDLHRYIERGAEILSAKLITADTSYRLDALSFRISGLKVETDRHDHWTQLLDERLEKIVSAWDQLDEKYKALRPRLATA
ncbi:MAG: hypothetical protein AAF657_22035 [Acidobacteriota bacterium]